MDDSLLEKGLEFFNHDVKTQVRENGIYRYPDLMLAPVADDSHDFIVKLPVMLVKVASEESNHRDRMKKRNEYCQISSLWYYLVANQDEMLVELHSREADKRWSVQYFTEASDAVLFPKFSLDISLSDIYSRVKF